MRKSVWVAGVTIAVAYALAAGCGYEEGQPVGHTEAKQDWQSPTANERGDELRTRLQLTQSDH